MVVARGRGAREVGVTGKVRVAVVFGGRSEEHAVSCASAGLVLSAIDRDRYDVLPIGITADGRWVLTSGDRPAGAIGHRGALGGVGGAARGGDHAAGRRRPDVSAPGEVPRDLGEVDVVLPLLHGTFGEDGTLQGLLEMAGPGTWARACSPARPAWTRNT